MSLVQQSFGKLSRLGLMAIFSFCFFSGFAAETASAQGDLLTIGSKAPALDIEHWVSDRDGGFSEVTEFEDGKVYIIEFWATWCGPCIRSMPHLAKLQGEYADKGVQLISVSRESLSKVEEFLEKKVRGGDGETYGELTSAYCLTTDPDSSVSTDYMRAAGQGGIPTAFIVGKSGLIEWIGHPTHPKGAMDKVLQEIVDDEWDREEFAVGFKKRQEATIKRRKQEREAKKLNVFAQKLVDMKADGDAKGAIKKLDAFAKDLDKDGMAYELLSQFRVALVIDAGGPDAVKALETLAAESKNPETINEITWGIVEKAQAGTDVDSEVLKAACGAAKRGVELARKMGDDENTAAVLDTHANLLFLCDEIDLAITAQEEAIKLTKKKNLKAGLEKFLKKLQEAKKKKDA